MKTRRRTKLVHEGMYVTRCAEETLREPRDLAESTLSLRFLPEGPAAPNQPEKGFSGSSFLSAQKAK